MTPDFAVIGRGLWGTAAAMYLARAGHSVALIGPSEPADPKGFDGPFASHHDAGRITRCIARDVMWARASSRSIANYAGLAEDSGVAFYTACGGMMASNEPDYAQGVIDTAEAEGFDHDVLSSEALADRFAMFRFAPGTQAIFDPTGGFIDPRAMRQAHEILAVGAGAIALDDIVTACQGRELSLASGQRLSAGHVLDATGSYAALSGLLPQKPDMSVFGRTAFLAEVSPAEAARLHDMPSLIWRPEDQDLYHYIVPPARYPDGRFWIKLGGEPDDNVIASAREAQAWMHGNGNPDVARRLEARLRALMPGLDITSGRSMACILAYSPRGFPYIGRVSDTLTLATACCGAGAKCADELGRIAARVAMGDGAAATELGADLTPSFFAPP